MTSEKLIEKFGLLLDMERKKQIAKRAKIRTLLKKLKQQKLTLKDRIGQEQNPQNRKRLKRNLKVIQAQRKKGIKLCKSIKCK
ncbi:MAG: hypothetical protein B6D70_04930 [gamma proteobacterium symbiont of Stewartia floridana]|nr:hypothetical protein [Candidatus Thiodiazotropha taylori]RLW51608.1 MAG: hypothetical protein B6D76_18880 [gamma proteobacterium symbiont of Stewartia floridana]RLW62059.1 MAG: hypothetical protein B6D75_00330 [gamma proteobacterium symbiont of Stewartia floridana]RLW65102.1 MAG: hypothetical protein B6D70_04930 [gamma proteobacterium symbiont of Stewartia floridana]RLW67105.1 MAG: hypothetical protein B6D73_00200 [gamma proteobacterium symbiont of Stewartia floridana]